MSDERGPEVDIEALHRLIANRVEIAIEYERIADRYLDVALQCLEDADRARLEGRPGEAAELEAMVAPLEAKERGAREDAAGARGQVPAWSQELTYKLRLRQHLTELLDESRRGQRDDARLREAVKVLRVELKDRLSRAE